MTKHPLDPLTEEEIPIAVQVIRDQSGLDDTGWFETITLEEPTRDELASGARIDRRAYVCCYEPSSNRTLRGVARLSDRKLLSWDHVPGAQARIVPDEFADTNRIVKADQRFVDACALRGVTDLDKVLVESWAGGNFGFRRRKASASPIAIAG